MILSLIVAYARDEAGKLVIGLDNKIPWYNKEDLARFRRHTTGFPVIMGRKTHESIGRVLPNRKNIVLTSQNIQIPGAVVVSSMEQALEECEGYQEAFLIGGHSIYAWGLDKVDRMYITAINEVVSGDTFFPGYKQTHFKVIDKDEHPEATFYIFQRSNYKTSALLENGQTQPSLEVSSNDNPYDFHGYIF